MPERSVEKTPSLTPEKARQGRPGPRVLLVLLGGLVLAMAVWALVEMYGWTIEPNQQDQVGDPATVGEGNTGGGATTPAPAQ